MQALAKHKQTGLCYTLSSASRASLKTGVVGVSSWSGSRPCQGSRLPLRWGPKLSNVAYLAVVGHFGSAETTTVLHPRQFFHQSVSRMYRVDIRPHQSRTRRDTVNHRLTRSQLPIQLAQYRAAAGACSESVASPLTSIEYAGRGAAAVGTKIKGWEYDLELLLRALQGPSDRHRRQTHLPLLLRNPPYIGLAQSTPYRHSCGLQPSISVDRFVNFHVRT